MTTILTRADIERMKASVSLDLPQAISRRDQLKKLSDEKVKNWPNTLEALRNKKESFHKEKLDKEELHRQEIDREEAEIRRKERLEAIKRANDLLYEQTDKMKMLRSQTMYADVINDRFKQVEENSVRKQEYSKQKQEDHERVMAQIRAGNLADKAKLERAKEQVRVVAVTRERQLEEGRKRREAERDEKIAIGQAMLVQAKKLVEDEYIQQEEKQILSRTRNKEMLSANSKLRAIRDVMKVQEKLAEVEREAETGLIEDRKLTRKAIELRRFEKAQEKRQQTIDAAARHLAAQTSNENVLLEKQEKEIRDRQDKAFADKEEKRRKEWEETVRSRGLQVARREQEMRLQMEEDDRLAEAWRTANKAADDREAEKHRIEKDKLKRIKASQHAEGQLYRTKRVEERLRTIEQERILREISAEEDNKFSERCKDLVREYAAKGKPVYPLLRALEHTQPDLVAAVTK